LSEGYADVDFRLKGEFKWTQAFLDEEIKKGTTFIIKSDLLSIRFIRDEDGFKRPNNFIKEKYTTPLIDKPTSGVGTNENASAELKNLLGGDYFDYPKPVSLIQYISKFNTQNNDLILDFFAGSSTTADAILRNNIENKWSQRFIMVQLPEVLDESRAADSSQKEKILAAKKFLKELNRPENLAELSKERIRRASKRLSQTNKDYKGDLGFKVFKLDSSNLKPWDADFDSLATDLAEAADIVKTDRSSEDVLFEVLLKYGLDLTLPIETHQLAGKTVYEVGAGALIVCLDDGVTEAIAEAIGKLKETLAPEVMRVVFKDSSFANDAAKVNAVQVLKQYGIEDVKAI
jgi:adenine-specific DNA-methyltransferase